MVVSGRARLFSGQAYSDNLRVIGGVLGAVFGRAFTETGPLLGESSALVDKITATVTLASIDRLVHHSTILEMNVDSYRRKVAVEKACGAGRPATRATIKSSS